MAAARQTRKSGERAEGAQPAGTDRNAKLAALAAKGASVDEATRLAEEYRVPLPEHTGRVSDFGGPVRAAVVAPWVAHQDRLLFRGDHVLVTADVVDNHDGLVRL